jgi:hypothetical protein
MIEQVPVQVSKALTYFLYEDVAPAAVLRKRAPAIGEDGPTMFLVRWRDGAEDSWLPEDSLSDEARPWLPAAGARSLHAQASLCQLFSVLTACSYVLAECTVAVIHLQACTCPFQLTCAVR